jgi:superfamily II DNA or RNA helicase
MFHAHGELMANLRELGSAPDATSIAIPAHSLQRVDLPITNAWDAVCSAISNVLDESHRGVAWYSASAQADFKPYQFRPLLKFFGSAAQRLLIADETGLGKTIETGYIILEHLARGSAKRILVVVPPRLKDKWRAELRVRFGLHFTVLESFRSLLRVLREPNQPFLGIVSEDAARSGDICDLYCLLGDPAHAIDLLVIDEVHELIGREQETIRRQFVQALSFVSGAVVGLSATPVHLEINDLGRVLQVIYPGLIANVSIDKEVDATALVNQIAHEVMGGSKGSPSGSKSLPELMDRLNALTAGLPEDELRPIQSFLQCLPTHNDDAKPDDMIRFRESALLSTKIGSHLTRTRASEVGEDRVRDIKTNRIALDNESQSIVKGGLRVSISEAELFRQIDALLSRSFSHVHRGQLASSLPAIIDLLRRGAKGASSWEAVSNGFSSSFGNGHGERALDDKEMSECKHLVDLAGLVSLDTKWEHLRERIRELKAERSIRKALLFTHWIPTYNYLSRRLQAGAEFPWFGISPSSDDDEVATAIHKFTEHNGFAILLVTDRMREGFDLDAADCVINYDLPYNPQVIEQRIGRVDRVSQRSNKITVINMVVKGSLDEEVYDVLLSRTAAFERVVGTMRPITQEMAELVGKTRGLDGKPVQLDMDVATRKSLMEHGVFLGVEELLDPEIGSAHLEQVSWPTELRWMAVSKLLSVLSGRSASRWDETSGTLRCKSLSEREIAALREVAGRTLADAVVWTLEQGQQGQQSLVLNFTNTREGLSLSHPLVRVAVHVVKNTFGRLSDDVHSLVLNVRRELLNVSVDTSLICLVRFTYDGSVGHDSSVRLYALSETLPATILSPEQSKRILSYIAEDGSLEPPVLATPDLEELALKGCRKDFIEWLSSHQAADELARGPMFETKRAIMHAAMSVLSDPEWMRNADIAKSRERLSRSLRALEQTHEGIHGQEVHSKIRPGSEPEVLLCMRVV